MQHWILQCNPERYRLSDALQDGFDIRSWTVARHHNDMTPGDDVAMWVSGSHGGVYLFGEVISEPEYFQVAEVRGLALRSTATSCRSTSSSASD